MPPRTEARGQALPLAIAALFCIVLLLSFAFRSTERLLQRERVRARADVTAFSGGVAYARGLNVLAASQKAVAAGWVAFVFDKGTFKKRVQKLQKALMNYGPLLSLAAAQNAGLENQIFAAPIWNKDVIFAGFSHQDFIPSYNVEAYSISDAVAEGILKMSALLAGESKHLEKGMQKELEAFKEKHGEEAKRKAAEKLRELLPGRAPEGLYKDSYSYTRADGTVVEVDSADVEERLENGPRGRKVLRKKANKRHNYRYVRQDLAIDETFQLSLKEGQPHMVTVFAFQLPSGRLQPGLVTALSQVEVAGGSLSLGDLDGSTYGATLVPVGVFPESGYGFEGAGALVASIATQKDIELTEQGILKQVVKVDDALSLAQALVEGLPFSAPQSEKALRALSFVRELQLVQH